LTPYSGLPKPSDLDSKKFRESDFNFKLEQVREYLDGLHVVFHQGMFPAETVKEVENERFSFVHLDVDLYESTLHSLAFFYPRLPPGAIIVSHDYVTADGVNRAFEEFFPQQTRTRNRAHRISVLGGQSRLNMEIKVPGVLVGAPSFSRCLREGGDNEVAPSLSRFL